MPKILNRKETRNWTCAVCSVYFSDSALLRCIALAGVRVDPMEGKVYMVRRKGRSQGTQDGGKAIVDFPTMPTDTVCVADGRVVLGSKEEAAEPVSGVSASTLHHLFNFVQLQWNRGYPIQRAHRSFFQDYMGHEIAWELELEAEGVITRGKGDEESSLIPVSNIEINLAAARTLLAKHGL